MKFLWVILSLTTFILYEQTSAIINGTPADLNKVHYQVALMVPPYVNGTSFCGGVLISYGTVLTRPSCIRERPLGNFLVFAGLTDFNSISINGTTTVGQSRRVSKVIIHEDYMPGYMYNDIAILYLESPFVNAFGVSPVEVRTEATLVGESCVVSGFGSIRTSVQINTLLKATITTVERRLCESAYEEFTHNMICAHSETSRYCDIDSGGPLVCSGKLAGLISSAPCNSILPGVYTDVAKFVSWIVMNS